MKAKKIFLLLVLFFLTFYSYSDGVPENTRDIVAKKAYYEKAILAGEDIKYDDIHIVGNPNIFIYEKSKNKYGIAFQIYQIKDLGFIIIASSDLVKPVLAYSFENSYSKKIPKNVKFFLDNYVNIIKKAELYKIKQPKFVKEQWDWYKNATPKQIAEKARSKNVKNVEPLLLTNWSQGKYYNTSCPEDADGDDGHVYVGCVALSTSMIMKYYNYPDIGEGSVTSYNSYNGGYGTFTVDFSQENFKWENMPLSATRYNHFLSDLLFDVGVAVNMNWGPDGSGTYTEFVSGALKNNFKYSSDVEMVKRSDYSTSDWIALLQNQLDNKWPMVYSGMSQSDGGHAWDCDGYQDTYFHMNWGWGGAYNGFFDLDDLTAGGITFDSDFKAVINIYPREDYPVGCSTREITGFEGSFEDGSGNQPYSNNWDCFTKIQPECGKYITLKFPQFNLEANDKVIIYDGVTTSSPVIATLTGSNPPSQFDLFRNTNPDGMLLEFVTDGSGTNDGWYATYSVKNCSVDTLTAPQGTFDDGSNTCDYSPNTYCKWYLNTTNDALLLTFDQWSLPTGDVSDYLQIYKGLGTSDLITKLTGDSVPTSYLIPSGQATVRFITNTNNEVGGGWEISYSPASYVDMISNNGLSLTIYPNPITDNSRIKVTTTNNMNLNFDLVNSLGEVIGTYSLNNVSGSEIINFDKIYSGKLNKGVYVLKAGNEKFTHQIKIIAY